MAPDYKGTINSWLNESRLLLWQLEDDIDDRAISQYNLEAHGGIGWVVFSLKAVLYDLIEAVQYSTYGYTSSFNYTYWWNAFDEATGDGAELTWQAICEAWAADDFEGRAPTIAFIDRMRQLLWNERYDVRWAAKPEGG